jgi:ribonuclease E
MSRQRLRMSLIETSSEPCPYCEGTGIRRSTDSAALVVLRAIQEAANNKDATSLLVFVPTAVALYILNQKRQTLAGIEQSTGFSIILTADDTLILPAVRIERINASGQIELVTPNSNSKIEPDEDKTSKRRRRPRRRISSDVEADATDVQSSTNNSRNQETSEAVSTDYELGEDKAPKRRRRGKRGGRRRRGRPEESNASEENSIQSMTDGETHEASKSAVQESPVEETAAVANEVVQAPEESTDKAANNGGKAEPSETDSNDAAKSPKIAVVNVDDEVAEKPKKGWWQRG